MVAEDDLQGVFAWCEFDRCFRLSATKVLVGFIGWNGVFVVFQFGVDDQVVMSCFGFFRASRRYSHTFEAKCDSDRA